MKMYRRPQWPTLIACSLLITTSAHAEYIPQIDDTCIEVIVDGQRALPLDCYARMMAPEPETQHRTHNPALDSAEVTKRQPNQTGQFSQSALRNRMGSNLGHSAKPSRPQY